MHWANVTAYVLIMALLIMIVFLTFWRLIVRWPLGPLGFVSEVSLVRFTRGLAALVAGLGLFFLIVVGGVGALINGAAPVYDIYVFVMIVFGGLVYAALLARFGWP